MTVDPRRSNPDAHPAGEPPLWPVYGLVVVLGLLPRLVGIVAPDIIAVPLGLVLAALPGWLFPGEPPWRLSIAAYAGVAVWALTLVPSQPRVAVVVIVVGYLITWALVAVGRAVRLRSSRL